MTALHRRTEWREASLDLRVAAWLCAVCGLVPSRSRQLEAAHLLALSEIRREFGSAVARHYLTDERNLAVLCGGCHDSLDFLLLNVRDPARLSPSQRGKLWKRIARHLPEFAALLGQRVRYREQLRRERAAAHAPAIYSANCAEGARGLAQTTGAGRLAPSEEHLIDDARARFDRAMAAREREEAAVTA